MNSNHLSAFKGTATLPDKVGRRGIEGQGTLSIDKITNFPENWFFVITKIENILIKSQTFRLPGKKQLLKSNPEINVVVFDVTENPVKRPKKNRKNSTVAKRKSTH